MFPDIRASCRAVWWRQNCCCCYAFRIGCEEWALALPLALPWCSTSVLLCSVISVDVMFVPVSGSRGGVDSPFLF